MKICDQQALMDEMEIFVHHNWHFLCSAEQLPTGVFHAVVRYRHLPGDGIQTLMVDQEMPLTSRQSLVRAKELALKWAPGQGREVRENLGKADGVHSDFARPTLSMPKPKTENELDQSHEIAHRVFIDQRFFGFFDKHHEVPAIYP